MSIAGTEVKLEVIFSARFRVLVSVPAIDVKPNPNPRREVSVAIELGRSISCN